MAEAKSALGDSEHIKQRLKARFREIPPEKDLVAELLEERRRDATRENGPPAGS